MVRVLVAIALLFAAVLGLDWLGGVPVSVAVEWPGGAAAPPLRVVVVALVVFAVLAVVAYKIISGILHGPEAMAGWFRARRRDKGYRALSRGMIAVGSGDVRLAHRFADEARRHLPNEPLVLLLTAQTAQIEGKSEAARASFTRMLANDETKLLGLRGLFIEATRSGDLDAARQFAADAQAIAPGVPWAATAMMEYQSGAEDWEGALATLESSASARVVDKTEQRRLRAVLLTARAQQAEDTDPDHARTYALEAHRLAPGFVPAAVIAARLLTRAMDTRKAAKVVETAWKENPHPELAEVYLHVRTGDSARDRLKRARMLESLKPHHPEGAVAVARAALDARDFPLARQELAKVLRQQPSQRICMMMAELEEKDTGDAGRVREWLGRAVRAPRDEAWTADGVVTESWAPISPVTGRLDAYEWRVPVASDSGVTELDGSDLAELAVRPLAPPEPPPLPPTDDDEAHGPGGSAGAPVVAADAPVPPTADEKPPVPATAAAVTAAEPVVTAPPPAAAPAPVAVAPTAAAPAQPAPPKPSFVQFPQTVRPDDPGSTKDRAAMPGPAFV